MVFVEKIIPIQCLYASLTLVAQRSYFILFFKLLSAAMSDKLKKGRKMAH